jgi:heme exporter protein C
MRWEHLVGGLGLLLLAAGNVQGLFFAPPEAMMGDVGRIIYIHVPTAWAALLLFTGTFACAVGALWTGRPTWDAGVEATAELGVILTALMLFQGSMWARPTWGVFWDWDPRLTTSAVLLVLFLGVLVLRRMIDQPDRRLTITAVAAVVAYVDVPVVWFGVKWWRSLHQTQSTAATISEAMRVPMYVSALGMVLLAVGLSVLRGRQLLAGLQRELAAPELPARPEPVRLGEEA